MFKVILLTLLLIATLAYAGTLGLYKESTDNVCSQEVVFTNATLRMVGLSGGLTDYRVGSINGTNAVYWVEPSGTTNAIFFADAP